MTKSRAGFATARDLLSVALIWRLRILVTGGWFCAHGKQIIASSGLHNHDIV